MTYTVETLRGLLPQFKDDEYRAVLPGVSPQLCLGDRVPLVSDVLELLKRRVSDEKFFCKDDRWAVLRGDDLGHLQVHAADVDGPTGDHYGERTETVALDDELLQVVCQNLVDVLTEREVLEERWRREQEACAAECASATAKVLARALVPGAK